jgi:hypothetical protein
MDVEGDRTGRPIEWKGIWNMFWTRDFAAMMCRPAACRTALRGLVAWMTVVVWAVVVCGLAMSSPTLAQAGEYHVYSCRMPNGEVAPTDGWSETKSGTSASTEDTCASGGALVAALGDGATHEVEADHATWTFSAPSGMAISAARLRRAGDADGGWGTNATYQFWLAGPDDNEVEADVIDQCVAEFGCPTGSGDTGDPGSATNLVTVQPENLDTHLYANASCGGSPKFVCPSGKGDPNGYAAVVYLYAADLVLVQSSQPSVSNIEGELATASTLAGTADLAFHASDSGSGVYQAVFTVDGAEVGRTVLDSSSHCHDVGQTSDGLPAFLYLQPCAPSLNADVQFDTTTLSDGTHHLVVSVTNAAGNSTVALDRKITVSNHPPAPEEPAPESPAPKTLAPETPSLQAPSPGQGPSGGDTHEQQSPIPSTPQTQAQVVYVAPPTLVVHWASTARAARASEYGRSQAVSGRLTEASGAPIGGAAVQVLSTPAFQGARTKALTSVRTGADGSFRLRLPASLPSTRLTFAYAANQGQAAPTVTAQLTLAVPARVSLRVTPKVSHVGGTIVFKGALSGGPLPPGGKQMILEARTLQGPWRQFQVLSTATKGRFKASYRFRLAGPIDYQFRAVCPHEADFPYGAGASPTVLVRER